MALHPRQQAATLAVITLAVFWPTLFSGLVYDARLQILTDPFLHDPRNWFPVLSFGVLRMDVLDFNRPVNLASLMVDAAVWGREPFGYHLTSVLLHAANVVMVWGLVRRLGPGHPAAAAAVLGPLVFAVHPVVTEAVCEPSFREDLLVAFFTLAAMLLAIGHDAARAGFDGWRALGCTACCLLAIGAKESGIAASCMLGMLWWSSRRGATGDGEILPASASAAHGGGFWLAAIGGGAMVTAAFLVARFLLEPTPSAIFEARPQYPGGSLAAALAIEPRILALYAQLILLPVNQCADYGLFSVRHLPLPVAFAIIAGLVAGAWFAIRADRRMAIAVALIVLPLVPVSNLVPIYRAAADRYLYLSLAGVGLAVGLLLDAPWLAARAALREKAVIGCVVAVVVLAVACTERQKVWAGPLALWEDTFRKNPVAFTAASGLGEALRELGRLPEAERATREAIRLSEGKRGDPLATLALILDEQGREQESAEALAKAIEVDPKLVDPDRRVAVMAMERPVADALKKLLERHSTR